VVRISGDRGVRRIGKGWHAATGAVWLAGALALGGCVTDQMAEGPAPPAPAVQQPIPAPPPGVPVAGEGAFFPNSQEGVPPITTETIQENAEIKYYPSDEPLRLGIEHFNRGHFGIAERYFQDAVEKAPKDASAWIGLAASYDRLGRFDLADRAYKSAIHLVGETTSILNNLGYSYMLRGNLPAARRYFLKAYEREPGNPTILNNLKLLNESHRFITRSSDAL
jgi:tetratricopeptide (TPR) repeat protein